MKNNGNRAEGFSLTETAIAIALVGFVLAGILSGIPGSLQMMTEADTRTVKARIAQSIMNEVQLNEWKSVGQYHNTHWYFDGEGIPLQSKDDKPPEMQAFHALVTLADKTISLPGAQTVAFSIDPEDNSDIKVITIRITHSSEENYDFEKGFLHKTFSSWITRMDLP